MTALREAFPSLYAQGFGVIDVGCRGGAHPILQAAAGCIDLVGFEADAEEGARLAHAGAAAAGFKSVTWLPYALGADDREALLHRCRSEGASSFYKPARAFLDRFPQAERFDIVTSVPVAVRSLDRLRADPAVRMPPQVDFIKIDTQGSELDVLRGAEETLRRQVVAVEVEVEFTPLYADQPVFRDVDAFLSGCGFSLFKLRRQEWVRRPYADQAHRTAGQLVFGDALYLRDPLDARQAWQPRSARDLEALILVATLYHLHDFALELLAAPCAAALPALPRALAQRYVRGSARRLGSFRERLRMVRAALSRGERFRRHAARWARGDVNFYPPVWR